VARLLTLVLERRARRTPLDVRAGAAPEIGRIDDLVVLGIELTG
jgi:hypothetical protein